MLGLTGGGSGGKKNKLLVSCVGEDGALLVNLNMSGSDSMGLGDLAGSESIPGLGD